MLLTGTFTRQELIKWKVKDLKCLLNKRSISTEGCKEKQELIDLIVINFGNMTRNDDIEERSVSKFEPYVFFWKLNTEKWERVLYTQGFQSGPVPGTFTRLRSCIVPAEISGGQNHKYDWLVEYFS